MFSIGSCVWKLVSQLVTLFLEAVEPLKAWDLWRKQVTEVRVSWGWRLTAQLCFLIHQSANVQSHIPEGRASVPFSPQLTVPSNCKPKQTLSSNKPGGVFCQVFETRKKKRRMQLNSFPSPSDQKFYKGVVTGRFLMTWSLVSSKRSGI